MKNKKKIIVILMVILFSILRFLYLKDLKIDNNYELLGFQFADLFLIIIYLPLYIFLIVGEIKKYDNSNFISRFNRIDKYNFYILRKIMLITFEYIITLLIVNWIETNLRINNILDFNLFLRYVVYLISLFLAFIVIAYIYFFVFKLINEVFAIFVVIILNMLEYLEILDKFLFNKLYNDFVESNYYKIQLNILIYLLIIFIFLYLINSLLWEKIDVQRGEYEQ